ncbi:MAG: hypothetical protein H5T33_04055 [Candidatus Methanosuratus sp.]|nr:hypothetical protein [Candidatus Methanosuratincola sp.]
MLCNDGVPSGTISPASYPSFQETEIEAGRAKSNCQFLKGFFEACATINVDYRVLAGNHTITLRLTDAAGNTESESWMITASEAAAGGGADMTLVYVGIAVVVVILGAAAAYLAMRKSKR